VTRPIALLLLLVATACSSYEATVDVQIAAASEGAAPVASGIYAASDALVAAAPRLPFKQAIVDAHFEQRLFASRTWHVKLSFADERLRWHATADDGSKPDAIVVSISAPGRKSVERRFECPKGGVELDLVGVLERDR